MNLGAHAEFIIAAYLVAAIVIVVMIAWVLIDYRAQRRQLEGLEARGVTRRSERASRVTT